MAILDRYVCDRCHGEEDAWRDELVPECCGGDMRKMFCTNTHEWGGPRTYRELREEPFSSRSELATWAKERNLECVGDKEGGSRNEDHSRLGKLHSYPGAPKKRSELF